MNLFSGNQGLPWWQWLIIGWLVCCLIWFFCAGIAAVFKWIFASTGRALGILALSLAAPVAYTYVKSHSEKPSTLSDVSLTEIHEPEGSEGLKQQEPRPNPPKIWEPGSPHPSKPHVIAAAAPDTWILESGYTWANPNTLANPNANDLTVRWSPGIAHQDGTQHCVAAQDEGTWLPAKGYKWSDPKHPAMPAVLDDTIAKQKQLIEIQILDAERAIIRGSQEVNELSKEVAGFEKDIKDCNAEYSKTESSAYKALIFAAHMTNINKKADKQNDLEYAKAALGREQDALVALKKKLIEHKD